MFSQILAACADPKCLVAAGPPGAGGCVSGSARVARQGSEDRATAVRRGEGTAIVYVLDPAYGPVGQPRYRRELEARISHEEWQELLAAGAVTPERARELIAANRRVEG